MSEPRLTRQAESDLDELWAYIAATNHFLTTAAALPGAFAFASVGGRSR
jgi:hypothetical protein